MTVAGRLTGFLDGRPVVIEADESGFLVTVSTWRGAWAMRECADSLLPVLGLVKRSRVPVRLRLRGSMAVNLLPTPGLVARCFVPKLGGLG
jgi:hypothetical protein